ncbi:hypothetical protein [Neobacillus jeddahensis]|uniref:hypothetical protein n=1 Tax=Neobacillus jeddahensis TaxID=1461580 RepID=UPI00058E5A66|nr:hypothetical protein [Neobacillus jeddahensis]
MNTKKKKGIFWGVLIAVTVFGISILHHLFAGNSGYARGPHGHGHGGMMTRGGGFGPHQMMNGPQHDGGFPWLFLFIGLAVLFLLIRWMRKRAKATSMKQFIDTSLVGSHIPVSNQQASLLDQWEKNLLTKKENE